MSNLAEQLQTGCGIVVLLYRPLLEHSRVHSALPAGLVFLLLLSLANIQIRNCCRFWYEVGRRRVDPDAMNEWREGRDSWVPGWESITGYGVTHANRWYPLLLGYTRHYERG